VLLGMQEPHAVHNASATADASVMLSESEYAAHPWAVGDVVQLAWAAQSAHALRP
jgi:putative spermidine/putrescine transport system ATP-binding protein